MIIYRAYNTENGKSYIGQTIRTMEERRTCHQRNARNKGFCHLSRALRKYGLGSFTWEVIDTSASDKATLDKLEQYYIDQYDSFDNGYNLTTGGQRGSKKVRH